MNAPSASLSVPIKRLPDNQDLALPEYATSQSAGMDLLASVIDKTILQPGEYAMIPTGIAIALPDGYEAQIRPRSGLAAKFGIGVLNSPGTIDADYRGEIGVILINHGKQPFTIERGMRIAQMIIAPYTRCQWAVTDTLSDSERGSDGFGSTGTSSKNQVSTAC